MSHKKNNSIIIPRVTQKSITKTLTDGVFKSILRSDFPPNVAEPFSKRKLCNYVKPEIKRTNSKNACFSQTNIFKDDYKKEVNLREKKYTKKDALKTRYDTHLKNFTTV